MEAVKEAGLLNFVQSLEKGLILMLEMQVLPSPAANAENRYCKSPFIKG